MPLQNRVTPTGEIIHSADRGDLMGNRGGQFHTATRELSTRRWHSKQWICCVLQFKDRQRSVMAPRQYTELFFLDEATALSAGHRPCFECRRKDAMHFATLWNAVRRLPGRAKVDDMDELLHVERTGPISRTRPLSAARLRELPDGVMVCAAANAHAEVALLLWAGQLSPWSSAGYGPAQPIDDGGAWHVLTPPSMVDVLAQGYRPTVHGSRPRR
jgi:hypothetical protein